jgi:hypothetical protein
MTACRHHYIPQCYLKAFAVPLRKKKPQLQTFDRIIQKAFATAIGNIGQERDFNRIDVEGHPPDAIEGGLAIFEGELAPALTRTIAADQFQNNDDRNLVLTLMAS